MLLRSLCSGTLLCRIFFRIIYKRITDYWGEIYIFSQEEDMVFLCSIFQTRKHIRITNIVGIRKREKIILRF